MSLGLVFAVIFVLAATLTLLPAVLCRLGAEVDGWRFRGRTPASAARRFAAWGERLWRRPVGYGLLAL